MAPIKTNNVQYMSRAHFSYTDEDGHAERFMSIIKTWRSSSSKYVMISLQWITEAIKKEILDIVEDTTYSSGELEIIVEYEGSDTDVEQKIALLDALSAHEKTNLEITVKTSMLLYNLSLLHKLSIPTGRMILRWNNDEKPGEWIDVIETQQVLNNIGKVRLIFPPEFLRRGTSWPQKTVTVPFKRLRRKIHFTLAFGVWGVQDVDLDPTPCMHQMMIRLRGADEVSLDVGNTRQTPSEELQKVMKDRGYKYWRSVEVHHWTLDTPEAPGIVLQDMVTMGLAEATDKNNPVGRFFQNDGDTAVSWRVLEFLSGWAVGDGM